MNKKYKDILAFDSIFFLAMAIAVWIPCFIQIGFDLASLYLIANTFLFGTAYLMLTRMALCLILIFKSKEE
jgi:hypothetical protein